MIVRFTSCEKPGAPGRLAEAELHFTDGPLRGMKLIGFSIWERRGGGGRNVTFPARQYSVNGERRSFALLRPAEFGSQLTSVPRDHVRDLILEAYAAYEAEPRDGYCLDERHDAPCPQPCGACAEECATT